jgi:hypothetical protein
MRAGLKPSLLQKQAEQEEQETVEEPLPLEVQETLPLQMLPTEEPVAVAVADRVTVQLVPVAQEHFTGLEVEAVERRLAWVPLALAGLARMES